MAEQLKNKGIATFRYALDDAGYEYGPGEVEVRFLPGQWADTGGAPVQAPVVVFRVEGPTADLANPLNRGNVDLSEINNRVDEQDRRYIEVTFRPTRALNPDGSVSQTPRTLSLITDAGAHPTARHVAHVAVMDYRQGFGARSFPDLERIETCCKGLWEAIETVDESGPISVAMVALGAGTGQLGVRAPTEIACRTLKEHLGNRTQSKIGDVTFYGYQLTEYIATPTPATP